MIFTDLDQGFGQLDGFILILHKSATTRFDVQDQSINTFGHFFKTWTSVLNGPGDWNAAPDGLPSPDQYTLMDYGLYEPFELIMY